MLDSRNKRTELFWMSLFLKEAPFSLVLVAPVEVGGPEVLAYCGLPLPKNFDAFFRHTAATRREVKDLAPRTISKPNVNVNVVLRVGVKIAATCFPVSSSLAPCRC